MIMKKKKTLVKTPTVIDTPKVTSSPTKNTTKTPATPERIVKPYVNDFEGDSMRDLFFIIKGQYRKGVEPSFVNDSTGDVSYLGGYDPERQDTAKWYMCIDKVTYTCVSCGSNLDKVLNSVYNTIMKYKGSAKKYFKHISDTTNDDYYETHYLGKSPLTPEQRSKKAEGKCPRTSPSMRCLYNAVYEYYGYFFNEQVQEKEDQAYKDLEEVIKESKPINRTRKIMRKTPVQKVEMETPKTPQGLNTKLKKVGVKKLGVRKLSIG